MNAIETFELTRQYGRHTAVDQVNLTIAAGAICGLVGPNGAGKTTLLRVLATLIPPTGGDASIAGISITGNRHRVRRVVGYMPETFGAYADMTVAEYLRFFAACYGVPRAEHPSLVNDLLQLVDLAHRRDDSVGRLTRGMKQRLSLARTLAHDPQVLLLDEPLSGADPRARVEMRELIKELRSMGKTIMLTAPVLADLENLATHAAVMVEGRISPVGTYEGIRERIHAQRVISVKFFGNIDLARDIIAGVEGVLDVRLVSSGVAEPADPAGDVPAAIVTVLKELRVTFDGVYNDASEMLRLLMRSGVQVVSFGESIEAPFPSPPHRGGTEALPV